MATKKVYELRCPHCGAEVAAELWEAVDGGDDGERRALLNGEVNRVTCAACGKGFRVDKAVVYKDAEAGIFVQYDPVTGGKSLEEVEALFQKARATLEGSLGDDMPEIHLTVEWPELIERIYLLEEGLNARLVEHIKYVLYSRNPGKLDAEKKSLLFDAEDSTEEALCFVVQDRASKRLEAVLNFARSDYEALENAFSGDGGALLLEEEFPGGYWSGRRKFLADRAEGMGGMEGMKGMEGRGGHDDCGCGCEGGHE